MNERRTLSGLTRIRADQLELPASRRAIAINGNYGVKGQTIQKDENNKLKWGFIDDIEIPDGSIEGNKLAPNITFSTTGNITASIIEATTSFKAPSSTNAFLVNNDSGSAGMVLQKSSGNVLQWGFVDDIEIPDNSITGDKL